MVREDIQNKNAMFWDIFAPNPSPYGAYRIAFRL